MQANNRTTGSTTYFHVHESSKFWPGCMGCWAQNTFRRGIASTQVKEGAAEIASFNFEIHPNPRYSCLHAFRYVFFIFDTELTELEFTVYLASPTFLPLHLLCLFFRQTQSDLSLCLKQNSIYPPNILHMQRQHA